MNNIKIKPTNIEFLSVDSDSKFKNSILIFSFLIVTAIVNLPSVTSVDSFSVPQKFL